MHRVRPQRSERVRQHLHPSADARRDGAKARGRPVSERRDVLRNGACADADRGLWPFMHWSDQLEILDKSVVWRGYRAGVLYNLSTLMHA